MNPDEYAKLDAVERDHWFYRGKRRLVRRWIERTTAAPAEADASPRLLDVGAGTGRFATEMADRFRVVAVDDHAESAALAARRPNVTFLKADSGRLPFADGAFDVATALDVLEHLDDDLGALREMARVVKPSGVVVVTVPAFRLLWSRWDVVLHHRRRYHWHEVMKLARRADLEVVDCRYVNSAVFLPIVAYRWLRENAGWLTANTAGDRAEDRVPPAWLNGLLEAAFVGPALWPGFSPPVGVSVLAVLRRPAEKTRERAS
ncbi:MAG: class I SAM-dependent methyltransferase [Planctomycetia bacterium]